jgi:cathepsin L
MRGYAFTLAVVGVAASVATFAINAFQPAATNLKTVKVESNNYYNEFNQFLAENNRDYFTQEEYEERYQVFVQTLKEISTLNSQNSGATFGLNQFSDWTWEEYSQLLGAKMIYENDNEEKVEPYLFSENDIASNGVDWRSSGHVNAVKDQGSCGSCWAFSAAASMESIHAIKSGKLARLSEQQIVDCSHTYNYGCGGGMYDRAW